MTCWINPEDDCNERSVPLSDKNIRRLTHVAVSASLHAPIISD